jgi:hypothetical protein
MSEDGRLTERSVFNIKYVFYFLYCRNQRVLFLTVLSMKQCIYVEVRPCMCGNVNSNGGLCCVGFINPVCFAVAGIQRLALSIGPT